MVKFARGEERKREAYNKKQEEEEQQENKYQSDKNNGKLFNRIRGCQVCKFISYFRP